MIRPEDAICSKITATVSVGTATHFTDDRKLPIFKDYNDLLTVDSDKFSTA